MNKKKFSQAQRYAVFTIHGEKCYLCDEPVSLRDVEIDHVLPESLLHDPVRLSKILDDFGLPANFNLNSYQNWKPSHGHCNRKKLDQVFKPTPMIQLHLEDAERLAGRAKELEQAEIEARTITRSINLLRAKDRGQLSPDDIAAIRPLLTLQMPQPSNLVYGLARLVEFHNRHRLAELQGTSVQITPSLYAALEDNVLQVWMRDESGITTQNSYPVQLNQIPANPPSSETDAAMSPEDSSVFTKERMQEDLRVFGRRFVALTCRLYAPPDENIGQEDTVGIYFSASGFVIEVAGHWFLITAGHIIMHIQEILDRGGRYENWHLDDTFALGSKRQIYVDGPGATETIPFVLDWDSIFYEFNEDGTDYAFVYLDPYYVNLLRKNHVTPFEEEEWTLHVDRPADRTELIGMPHDQLKEIGDYRVSKVLVALKMHRVNDDALYKTEYEHLIQAHIPGLPTQKLPDFEQIYGMSGGPVVGIWIQPDGSERMLILGVQSQWNPEYRTIVATPIGRYAAAMKKSIVESNLAKIGGSLLKF
jgi:5-methylcytosine-specific restriction endonuclease McrA